MKKLLSYLRLLALPLAVVSCGEYFEFGEGKLPDKSELRVNSRELTVMAGDSCRVAFTLNQAEGVSNALYWESKNRDVCTVTSGMVKGVGEGTTQVMVMVLADLQRDSLKVNVLPRWEVSAYDYPYETVVYANVLIDEQPMGEHDIVGAFVGDELRGAGKLRDLNGRQYVELRIYGTLNDEENATIKFRCYRQGQGFVQDFPQTLIADYETHGTLSDLFKLSI